jgi:hypothetical protein
MKKILIAIMALAIVAFNAPVAAFATTDAPAGDDTVLGAELTITGDDTTLEGDTTPSGDDTTLDEEAGIPPGDDTTLDATSTPPTDDEGIPPGDDTTLDATSTATTTPPTPPAQHAPTDPHVGQTGGGGFSGTATIIFPGATPLGSVLGASTDAANCSISFLNYMKKGQRGNDIKALQTFLNTELGLHIPVTGYFGSQTFAAVKAFQLKYSSEILAPWVSVGKLSSQNAGTGYVYKTTKRKMNLIRCASLNTPPIPASELF